MTTIRFRAASPAPPPSSTSIAPACTSVTLNGRALDPAAVFDGARIALTGLAAENELVVDADCAYSRTGEGLHRFVDPVDGEVYLYTQFELADSRRVFANFEQPDLKAHLPLRGDRARATGRSWRNSADARAESAGDGTAAWRFAPTPPISTYITASWPARTTYVTRRRADRDGRRDPARRLSAARGWPSTSTPTTSSTVTKQGFDFFDEHFDYPYPFEKYDQVFVPEYNRARWRTRAVTFREEYIFRAKVTEARTSAARDDPARAGPHVVRRPRHHGVVGRPVAQRVLRRVGLARSARPRRPA